MLSLAVCRGTAQTTSNYLATDRDVYVSGEEVLLSAFLDSALDFKVLCLGLSGEDGQLIHSVNLKIEEHCASGHIYLPDSLRTGSYLLTAFSPNFRKQAIGNREILVVNRFESTDEDFPVRRAGLPACETLQAADCNFVGLQDAYRFGETGKVQITVNGVKNGRAAVVVSRCLPGWEEHCLPVQPDLESNEMLTRKEGVVVQGLVKNSGTGEAVSGATVFLSIPDSIPYFDYYKTWNDGRFYFLLPQMYGKKSLVVQAKKEGGDEMLQVELDEFVDSSKLKFQSQYLPLGKAERNYLADAIKLVTFQKVFGTETLKEQAVVIDPVYPYPFYGKPEMTVDPDEFFELEDFNAISKELLQAVRFRQRKDGYELAMVDYDLKAFLPGQPMILVDGVPTDDLSRIAPLGSREIDWIDVVPFQRFYGNLKMDGVLAIYTKKGDSAILPTSLSLLKTDVESLQQPVSLIAPKNKEAHVPDFRQVLYWNPDVEISDSMQVNFQIPDVKGTYRMQLIERRDDGHLFERTEYFTVSE